MADERTLARVCVRVWADDYKYLKSIRGNMGLNLLIRQIIHSYVVHVKDREQQQLNKIDDLDLPPIDISELEFDEDDSEEIKL